jgi:L-seryl-tRNA(Ser) seleniumtransferase
MTDLLRKIPKVDEILKHEAWAEVLGLFPEALAKEVLRSTLAGLRLALKEGREKHVPPINGIISEVRIRLVGLLRPGLKRVINGTGVIIHTNLGRSLLSSAATDAVVNAATHFTNLEYDLSTGKRGDRHEHCVSLLTRLTGAESGIVVNNNAAAVYLVLNTLAEGREVIVSRGELVEIGGSFRIPDVMRKSGALLREVGTTNRTYAHDYEAALCDNTAIIMKVHTSNYRIRGFTHEATLEECAALGRSRGVATFYDAGSGLLFPLGHAGGVGQSSIGDDLASGMDLLAFSGDKLLGGPQAGIIVGARRYVDALKKNPMTRAFRPDKFTIAALEATLMLYLDPRKASQEIPTLALMQADHGTLRRRAVRLAGRLRKASLPLSVAVVDVDSEVGGGSLPDAYIPSCGVALKPKSMTVETLETRLRALDIPVIGRVERDNLILDMRTILKEDEVSLFSGLLTAFDRQDS